MKMLIQDWLKTEGCGACSAACEWLKTLGPGTTMAEAWEKCRRPDWMFWALNASEMRPDDPMFQKLACALIRRTPLADGRTVWDLLTDERSRNAVEVAERFTDGKATAEELDAARVAAAAAAAAAAGAWTAAAAGAWTAAWTAAAAGAWTAAGPRFAADTPARIAADTAAWAAANTGAWDAQCDIIREYIKCPWKEKEE